MAFRSVRVGASEPLFETAEAGHQGWAAGAVALVAEGVFWWFDRGDGGGVVLLDP